MHEPSLAVAKHPWHDGAARALRSAGISACNSTLPAEGFEYAWQGKSHYLALHDIRLRDGEMRSDDGPPTHERETRGKLSFIPAGCRVWGWAVPASSHNSFTALYFDPREMEEDIAQRFRNAALGTQVNFSDPALFGTVSKLRSVLDQPGDTDELYLQSLLCLCAVEVCRLFLQPVPATSVGRLSAMQEANLYDYIEAHLAADIGLADLAKAAGLSRFHLIRTFRKTTGVTPYQYVLSRRIERARGLLREGRLTTEHVAREVGFKSSSHFIRRFRQLSGTTPSAYADAAGAEAVRRRSGIRSAR
jgi:AraC family transcriptional regulator